jgi:hypothetical protein
LSPAKAEYLYFVSKNDGTHTFSKTLTQHDRAVQHLRQLQKETAAKKLLTPEGTAPDVPDGTIPPLPPSGPS